MEAILYFCFNVKVAERNCKSSVFFLSKFTTDSHILFKKNKNKQFELQMQPKIPRSIPIEYLQSEINVVTSSVFNFYFFNEKCQIAFTLTRYIFQRFYNHRP